MMLPLSPPPLPPSQWRQKRAAAARARAPRSLVLKSSSDTMTYSAVISTCEKGGPWGEALALVGRVARATIEVPNEIL